MQRIIIESTVKKLNITYATLGKMLKLESQDIYDLRDKRKLAGIELLTEIQSLNCDITDHCVFEAIKQNSKLVK